MTTIIGLTGGIASGKSTVSTFIREKGIPVIDADVAAREVVEKGEEAYQQIVDTFGEKVLHSDGTINREELGAIIFNDTDKRNKLNSIVHPAVRKRMDQLEKKYIDEGFKTIVLDIPLLFENRKLDQFDFTILVYVDEEVQLKRLTERNHLTEEQAKSRIRSQMSLKDKIPLADEVIDNNGTIEETKHQLYDIFQKRCIR